MEGHSNSASSSSSGVSSQNIQSEDGRVRSFSGGSTGSSASSCARPTTSSLEKLANQLPLVLREFSWEIKNEFGKALNQLKKPVGNDWRLVASRLGFSSIIHELEEDSDPTMGMFKHCNSTTTLEFLDVLKDIGRSDIIEDVLRYLNRNHGIDRCPLLPTQESLEETDSELSHPLEESSSDISKLTKQPSEQEEDEEQQKDLEKFLLCKDSQEFWKNIPGSYCEKRWPDFVSAMNRMCPIESGHGGIDKLLCHIFKINYDEKHDGVVRLVFYFRLLAFFGPFKSGADGCLHKMYDIIVKSVSKSMGEKKCSWFAGYMNKEDTENRLSVQKPGYFLVRFSGSRIEEGCFVLAVKTPEDVIQTIIERDLKAGCFILAGVVYPDLISIVAKLRHDIALHECRQLLINPCPDLPLNANFISYTKASSAKRGRGRGRVR